HQITKSKNHKNIPKITKLDLGRSYKINTIQELKFFTKLEELEIKEPIKDASVLAELKNLKKIKLQKWNVKDLVVLNSCTGLEEVELRDIQGFESDFDCSELLSESKAKIELYLDSTKFERFPTAVSTFKSLTSLSMRDCNFTEIPESIGNLKQLTDLNLGKNKLSALPAGIGKLEQLIHLYLDSNQFSIFPDAVLSLKNLQLLWIRWNQIVSLPDGIGQMSSLKDLSLHENQLSDVPSGISKMSQLTELSLGKNKLTKFPEAVTLIKNLRILDLSENQITSIPDSIGAISTLEVLDLESTLIDSLPKTIEELTSLETLYLEKTKLKDLPDFFASMKSLKNIYFESEEYNKLKQWCEFEYKKYKTHLDSKKFPEAATRIKWLFSQKGADFLTLNRWEVKLKLSEGYDRKAEVFAADVFALAAILKDQEIFSIASRMTGDQYINAKIPFNQACYFALTGQKDPMLQAIRKAVELGKKTEAFMNESDFDSFKKDPAFLEALVSK
ncbi:leucine-rich repeat domain-containing protein, partial [Leptospira santarosai]|uniref:leucine-rich repeat domain-containing protein n=1 Tax=Leptospira santarosai TaxID=28183 RepID=UPI0003630B63